MGAGAEPAPPPALPGWLVETPPSAAPSAMPVAVSAVMRFAIAMMAAGSLAAVAVARAAKASERLAAAGSPGDVDEDEGAPMSMWMESPVSSVEDEEAEDAGIAAVRPVGRRPIPALLERG